MGVYLVPCALCEKDFQWFSGNAGYEQICSDCLNKKEASMDKNYVDSMKKTIEVQDELIKFLKTEIDRLKNTVTAPQIYPGSPIDPAFGLPYWHPNPIIAPNTVPWINPTTTPGTPLGPPYVITSTGPMGSGQVSPSTPVGAVMGDVGPIGQGSNTTTTFTTVSNNASSLDEYSSSLLRQRILDTASME